MIVLIRTARGLEETSGLLVRTQDVQVYLGPDYNLPLRSEESRLIDQVALALGSGDYLETVERPYNLNGSTQSLLEESRAIPAGYYRLRLEQRTPGSGYGVSRDTPFMVRIDWVGANEKAIDTRLFVHEGKYPEESRGCVLVVKKRNSEIVRFFKNERWFLVCPRRLTDRIQDGLSAKFN